jgi:hypothetical protein
LDPSHNIGELSDAVTVSGWRVTEESLDYIISTNRRFTAINFYECNDLSEEMVGMLAMRVGIRLHHVNFGRCYQLLDSAIETITSVCIYLNSMDLSGCTNLTDASLLAVSNNCHHVEKLLLNECNNVTDTGLLYLSTACNKLKMLHLRSCCRVSDRGIAAVLEGCPELRSLDVAELTNLTGEALVATNLNSMFPPQAAYQAKMAIPKNKDLIPDDVCTTVLLTALQHMDFKGCNLVTDYTLKLIGQGCTDLKAIVLEGCDKIGDEGLISLVNGLRLKNLVQQFNCKGCHMLTDESVLLMLRVWSVLISVDLTGLPLLTNEVPLLIVDCCQQLEQVRLKGSLLIHRLELQLVQQTLFRLTLLDLSDMPLLGEFDLQAILQYGLQLQHLELAGCKSLTNSALEHVANSCPNLRYLDMSKCPLINDLGVREIASSCKELRTLLLGYLPLLSDAALGFIGEGLPHLQELDVCSNMRLTGKGFAGFTIRHLARLKLSGCRAVTSESLVVVSRACPALQTCDCALSPWIPLKLNRQDFERLREGRLYVRRTTSGIQASDQSAHLQLQDAYFRRKEFEHLAHSVINKYFKAFWNRKYNVRYILYMQSIEKRQKMRVASATFCAAWWRRMVVSRRYCIHRYFYRHAVLIQATVRMHFGQDHTLWLRRRISAACWLQAVYRGWSVRWNDVLGRKAIMHEFENMKAEMFGSVRLSKKSLDQDEDFKQLRQKVEDEHYWVLQLLGRIPPPAPPSQEQRELDFFAWDLTQLLNHHCVWLPGQQQYLRLSVADVASNYYRKTGTLMWEKCKLQMTQRETVYYGPRGKIVINEDEENLKKFIVEVLSPLSPAIRFSHYTQQFWTERSFGTPDKHFSWQMRDLYEEQAMIKALPSITRPTYEKEATEMKLAMVSKARPPCPWCHGVKHIDVIFVQSGMGACSGCAANIVSRLNFAGRLPNATQHIVSFEPKYYNLLKSGAGGSEALSLMLPMTDEQKEKAMVVMSRELGPAMGRADSVVDGIRSIVRQYSKEEIEAFMKSGLTLEEWREMVAMEQHYHLMDDEAEDEEDFTKRDIAMVDTQAKYDRITAVPDDTIVATPFEKECCRRIQQWYTERLRDRFAFLNQRSGNRKARISAAETLCHKQATKIVAAARGYLMRKWIAKKNVTLGRRAQQHFWEVLHVEQEQRYLLLKRKDHLLKFYDMVGTFTEDCDTEMKLCTDQATHFDYEKKDFDLQAKYLGKEMDRIKDQLAIAIDEASQQNTVDEDGNPSAGGFFEYETESDDEGNKILSPVDILTQDNNRANEVLEFQRACALKYFRIADTYRHRWQITRRQLKAGELLSSTALETIRFMEHEQHHIGRIEKKVRKRTRWLGVESIDDLDVKALTAKKCYVLGFLNEEEDDYNRMDLVSMSWHRYMQRSKLSEEELQEIDWLRVQKLLIGQQMSTLDLEQEGILARECDRLEGTRLHFRMAAKVLQLVIKLYWEASQYERECVGLSRRRVLAHQIEGDDAISLAKEHNLKFKAKWNCQEAERLVREMKIKDQELIQLLERSVIFIEGPMEEGKVSDIECTLASKTSRKKKFDSEEWLDLYKRKPWRAEWLLKHKTNRGGMLGLREQIELQVENVKKAVHAEKEAERIKLEEEALEAAQKAEEDEKLKEIEDAETSEIEKASLKMPDLSTMKLRGITMGQLKKPKFVDKMKHTIFAHHYKLEEEKKRIFKSVRDRQKVMTGYVTGYKDVLFHCHKESNDAFADQQNQLMSHNRPFYKQLKFNIGMHFPVRACTHYYSH